MAQWGKNDNAANSVLWAPAQLNQAPTRANANLLFANASSNGYINGQNNSMVGADEGETLSVPVAHAGWQFVTVGSGGRAGRTQRETLVALSSMIGDADANTLPDFIITITSNPAVANVAAGANTSFTVGAVTAPVGQTIVYSWEVDATANGNWVALTNGGLYSNVATPVLFINAANSTVNNALYRAVASGNNATSKTSNSAVLHVTA